MSTCVLQLGAAHWYQGSQCQKRGARAMPAVSFSSMVADGMQRLASAARGVSRGIPSAVHTLAAACSADPAVSAKTSCLSSVVPGGHAVPAGLQRCRMQDGHWDGSAACHFPYTLAAEEAWHNVLVQSSPQYCQ